MNPQEFVTRVYNVQEGVIFDDLWPTDEKYKEVLYQANLVIDEFARQSEWSWLRKGIILGMTDPVDPFTVPKFLLPDDVDRVSMEFQDGIMLYRIRPHCHCHWHHNQFDHRIVDESNYIRVPFISHGRVPERDFMTKYAKLEARVYDRYIEFTRVPIHQEVHRLAVCDCQMKIPHLHICNDKCVGINKKKPINYEQGEDYNPCRKIEKHIFNNKYEDYMIWKTAYNTSKYSPIAGGIRAELNDTAQKLLSKIRSLDNTKTRPDVVKKKWNYKIKQVW